MAQTQVVRFRRSAPDARIVRSLQILLAAGAVLAVLGLWRMLQGFANVVDAADTLKANAAQAGLDQALVQAFVNLAYFAFGLLTLFLAVIPIRYTLLIRAVPRGDPRTLRSVRGVAVIQVLATLLGLASIQLVLGGTGLVEVGLSLTMFLPLAIVWYSLVPAVRDWYSEFSVAPLEAPGFRPVDGPGKTAAGDGP